MATSSDQTVGYGMVIFAGMLFTYYTVWVIILPFVDEDHLLHAYFLDRIYAIAIPVIAGSLVLTGLVAYIGMIQMRSHKPKIKTT
ncbi:hypothetical protein LSH36_27g05048 [Paralvinella palmiformis]|uniref:Dolichol phosphate-mannose biosynthesis regulatory protein n=1 Tax=Paralvinella palmiformis TaxID=53620 RepID=A0AAD9K9V5_9ANNE|nr:hypothetical protein LSH36_27g05048 [Paralvinella palmiformis]